MKVKHLVLVTILGLVIAPIVLVGIESSNPGSVVEKPAEPQLSPEEQERVRVLQEEAHAEWEKTKAGQICTQHRGWLKEDCDKLAQKQIWVGMKYEMLIYLFGKPNSINPSNYGGTTKYQYCWNNVNPSCFYDENGDQVIDAFN